MQRRGTTSCVISLVFLASALLTSGCAKQGDQWTKDRPPVYPASGQVLLNGEPVAKATLVFQPLGEGGKPGFALTDDKGNFNAQTFEEGDGLTEGKHRVSIKKTLMVDSAGKIVETVVDDGAGLTEKNFLPEKYGDFTSSGIEVTIEATKANRLEPFNLTGEAGGAAAK